ncbi:MAG: FkbM family methyltransferase [Vicinamibacterales bacterium]
MKRREFVAGVVGGTAAGVAGTLGLQQLRAEPPRPEIPEFARLSFSEQGEDIVLYHALRDLLGLERPTYMDIGAAHPVLSNNTYLLYGTGSTGVLVEPNPMYVEMLRRQRPNDIVVAAGIGVTDASEADYYEIRDNPLLNTFSPEQVEMLQRGNTGIVVERVSKMPLININRVIDEQMDSSPDLVSTDIEGLDYAIIQTLDLDRYRPGVICCEGVSLNPEGYQSDIARYLGAQGYVLRGGSMVNSVFVDARRIRA